MPIVIFPPWINEFYILDLKPQNSLIKWLVDEGYTVFVASWVNPNASYADAGIEDYITDGSRLTFSLRALTRPFGGPAIHLAPDSAVSTAVA